LKYLVSLLVSLRQKFQLLFSVIAHLVTISCASGALFLLGFYVIPVFAENIPHVSHPVHSEIIAPVNKTTPQKLRDKAIDQDRDGVPDIFERQLGSEVLLSDTDGDGISDGLEVSLKKKQHLIMTKMAVQIS